MKSDITKQLELAIIQATRKRGTFGVLECTIGWYGQEIVDYITYDTSGTFRCYEVKCSVSDFHSNSSKTFLGHYNYYVMTPELYEHVKQEIPSWVGVYLYGTLVSKAKRQNPEEHRPTYLNTSKTVSKTLVDILKDSMVRSLYREAQKLYDSGNDSLIQRKNRELSSYKSQLKSVKHKYKELDSLLHGKLGRNYLEQLQSLPNKFL